jgi:hypothetical protein
MIPQQILVHSCLIFCQSSECGFSTYDASNLGGITIGGVCITCTCMYDLQTLLFHFAFYIFHHIIHSCVLADLICNPGFCRHLERLEVVQDVLTGY